MEQLDLFETTTAVVIGCDPHPLAPHGFNRSASHTLDRYVCLCETWHVLEDIGDLVFRLKIAARVGGRDAMLLLEAATVLERALHDYDEVEM